jgi:hypothetical protein
LNWLWRYCFSDGDSPGNVDVLSKAVAELSEPDQPLSAVVTSPGLKISVIFVPISGSEYRTLPQSGLRAFRSPGTIESGFDEIARVQR